MVLPPVYALQSSPPWIIGETPFSGFIFRKLFRIFHRLSFLTPHLPNPCHATQVDFSAFAAIRHPCDEKPISPTARTATCAALNLFPSPTIHLLTNSSLPYIFPSPCITTNRTRLAAAGYVFGERIVSSTLSGDASTTTQMKSARRMDIQERGQGGHIIRVRNVV